MGKAFILPLVTSSTPSQLFLMSSFIFIIRKVSTSNFITRTTYISYSTQLELEPSQTSKMELFAEIVNDYQPLIILVKSSILDLLLVSDYIYASFIFI